MGIASAAVVLTLPMTAMPAAAATEVVDLGSTIDLGWASATSDGLTTAVSGIWAVGWANVDGVQRAFASDLSESPPRAVALGTADVTTSYPADVSGSWVVGGAKRAEGDYHAFAIDLAAATPELIDLNPDGMVWSAANGIDGQWAVGEIDAENNWWGTAWNLTGATASAPPQPIKLLPLPGDPYAWAQRVSSTWVVGESSPDSSGEGRAPVAWSLSGASIDVPVEAVGLPALTGEKATVVRLSGHWAIGYSRDMSSGRYLPVVWDLSDASPSPVPLPMTATATGGEALDADGNRVVGYEEFSGSTHRHPVVWTLSETAPPTMTTIVPTFAGSDCETCHANAIDGDWVVGTSRYDASSAVRAFAYNLTSNGPLLDLGALATSSETVGVDGSWVVGNSASIAELPHPVAWNLLAPSPPALEVTHVSTVSADLAWTVPAYTGGQAVTGYTLASRVSTDTAWDTAPIPADLTATGVPADQFGTVYEFKIRANTAAAEGAWSNVVTVTPVAPVTVPAAPAAPVAAKGKTGITLTWTDNGNGGAAITNHKVEVYSYTKATKLTAADYSIVNTITIESAATAYTVTGLTKGKTYAFTVSAGNSVGYGPFSAYSNVVRR